MLRCLDRSWCQFFEEQKDSFMFVEETEENKQEIMLYPGGRKCMIDNSIKNRTNILGFILEGLRKNNQKVANKIEIKYFRRDGK